MTKSKDAFRTISEVSDWLNTPAHVLRFWESKFSQIKPVKRAGGRRYYRPDDMALLGGIKSLLHDQGMTIKGAQKLIRERGVKYVASLSPSAIDEDDADLVDAAEAVEPPKVDNVVSLSGARAAAPEPTSDVSFDGNPAGDDAPPLPFGDDAPVAKGTADEAPNDADAEPEVAAEPEVEATEPPAAPTEDAADHDALPEPDTGEITEPDPVSEPVAASAEEERPLEAAPETAPEDVADPSAVADASPAWDENAPYTPSVPVPAEEDEIHILEALAELPPGALAKQAERVAPLLGRLTEIANNMGRR